MKKFLFNATHHKKHDVVINHANNRRYIITVANKDRYTMKILSKYWVIRIFQVWCTKLFY